MRLWFSGDTGVVFQEKSIDAFSLGRKWPRFFCGREHWHIVVIRITERDHIAEYAVTRRSRNFLESSLSNWKAIRRVITYRECIARCSKALICSHRLGSHWAEC